MAKGFGPRPKQQLGYVLNLMPEFHGYAAKFSMSFPGYKGPFIGITNLLEDAQVWKNLQHARDAIMKYYSQALVEMVDRQGSAVVYVQRLTREPDGTLTTVTVDTLTLSDTALIS